MKKLSKLVGLLLASIFVWGAALMAEPIAAIATLTSQSPRIWYMAHIQDYGWSGWSFDGGTCGTTGQSKRMEAIRIVVEGLPGTIRYKVHLQNIGWTQWVGNDTEAGTMGESRRMEAIRIQLVDCPGWSVQYRAHVQNIGWQDWVEDGEIAGTEGRSLRMEAIQIRLVRSSQ